jgi:hypothetical protein
MHRASSGLMGPKVAILILLAVGIAIAQQPSANPNAPSLKVSLRLPDNSTFAGLATLHVIKSDGSEATGKPGDSDGETVFSNLAPGTYSVEASSPGFVPAKQSVEMKQGHGLETLFLVLKPDRSVDVPSAPGLPVAKKNSPYQVPQGVDEAVPPVVPGVSCNLPIVLKGVGRRTTELVSNLEKFSATEHVEHFKIDKDGMLHSPETRSFEYVVSITQGPEIGFQLDEFRDGVTDPNLFPAGIATTNIPIMASIFHPLMVADFNFSCEGLGEWGDHPAWQIRFEQRQDRANRIRLYHIRDYYYAVPLKGRAWIDAATYQVLRLETDLVKPVKEIELTRERLSIEYGEVQFHTHSAELWLPETVEIYWQRRGNTYYRRHTFTDFKVFSIDTNQKFQRPDESYSFTNTSDHDVPGILVVNPVSGSSMNPVSIRFTIPAGQSIFKAVGRGKEINIPADRVGSAKFVYKGPEGSVKVDAYLVSESTLEVVRDTSLNP